MNPEAALWWSLYDANAEAARQRKILRPTSGADELIPAERLDFLASVTTTQFIQISRRGNPPPVADPSPAAPLAASSALPQQTSEGDWWYTCAKCGERRKWTPRGAMPEKPMPGAVCFSCYREGKK